MERVIKRILLRILVAGIFLQISTCSLLAEDSSKLILEKGFFGYSYKKDGKSLRWKEVKNILKSNPKSSAELDESTSYQVLSWIGAGVGGVLLINRFEDYITHNSSINSTNKSSFMTSFIGTFILSIFFGMQSDNHFRKAFDVYNDNLEARSGLSLMSLIVERESINLVFSF